MIGAVQFVCLIHSEVAENKKGVRTLAIPSLIHHYKQKKLTNVLHIENEWVPWPEASTALVNEFKTPGNIAMAFPNPFPTGVMGIYLPRVKTVNPSDYFKYLMHCSDGRFAKKI